VKPNREVRRSQDQMRRRLKVGDNGPMEVVPRIDWPLDVDPPNGMERFLKNRRFIVFDCLTRTQDVRLLMVGRLDGRDGVTWDELFGVKAHAGYDHHEAVEIYPERGRLVNHARMRHLWVFPLGIRCAFGLDPERA
jgi:hypothetical protein